MGAALIRSAFSANIKERRDCSTALFDARGRMISQAEHIPVHLGAMPDAVAAVIEHDPRPGEVWILNDPYAGGTHLPDVTTVSRTEVGFAVTRAHHADVGGREPGSMPADSRTLDEEGVVIPPTRLDDETLGALVARMRNPAERRGDLRAQLAAHRLAERRIAELCERRGRDEVAAAMDELYAYSERRMRAGIAALPDDVVAAVVQLADMPRVTSAMLSRLVERFVDTGAPIVASDYQGVHAPPTLYSRALFPELGGAEGDGSGRRLVWRRESDVVRVPWPADALADVDREEDWERMDTRTP